jgi:hypothetical protein
LLNVIHSHFVLFLLSFLLHYCAFILTYTAVIVTIGIGACISLFQIIEIVLRWVLENRGSEEALRVVDGMVRCSCL